VSEQDHQNEQGAHKEPPTPPVEVPPVSADVNRVNRTEKTQDQTRNSDQSPKKRWDAMTWFTGGIFFATTIYAIVSYSQWHEMHRQTQQAIDAQRPWVKITGIDLRSGIGPVKTLMFHFPPTRARMSPQLQVKVTVKNIGNSVAQDIEVVPILFFGDFVSDKWHDVVIGEEDKVCRNRQVASEGSGQIVFPSETRDWNMGIGGIKPPHDEAAELILCVNYRGAPETQYQTRAAAGLYERNNVIIPNATDADASILRLIRDPTADHAY